MKAQSLDSLQDGLKWSAALHAAALIAVILQSIFLPGSVRIQRPVLRVDLVGLPEILKKDLHRVKPADTGPLTEALKEAEAEAKKVKPTTPEAPPAPEAKDVLSRAKKLQSALDRIKSLEKIGSTKEPTTAAQKPTAPPILGNEISKGTSLSDDAVTSMQASYFDQVRDHLQNNWELPVWLARQNLSAQVIVTLDGRGMIRSVRFTKSSGNPQFDEIVRRTLRESQPLPNPPPDVKASVLLDGVLIGFPL